MSPHRAVAVISVIASGCFFLGSAAMDSRILPGHPQWPRVWVTYRRLKAVEDDMAALRQAGVGLMSVGARKADDARQALDRARRLGMKYHISMPDVTEQISIVRGAGLEPVPAVMLGGVYDGRAMDRHVFSFSPGKHSIIIEPPVYNRGYAYTRGSGGTGRPKRAERIAHYFPDMGAPLRAEIVVPLRAFDGSQHLKVIPAAIAEAPPGSKPHNDTVARLPQTTESRTRKLWRLDFDLTGLEGAMLDRVGIAVYWTYRGSNQYWMFGHGNVSAWAPSTRQAAVERLRRTLAPWAEANGGNFPDDVVIALRYGDECFYVTGHLNGSACSYPLWDYSEPAIAAFRRHAGNIEFPRTWGFPGIYGPDAYAWWLYTLHEGCAGLCGAIRDEAHRIAPGLLVFRNSTRMGVFHLSNDHDGSGQELLARNLDIVHLDPYPVSGSGYHPCIPRDMSYCAGLARRYHRPLVPWMQAHTYGGPGGLQHVSPDDVDRMAAEQWEQGADAVMWLGWGRGFTFPETRPDSWQRAVAFHQRLNASPPPKPRAPLAVLRGYRAWALSSISDGKVRNPADWMLRQLLEVWAVKHRQPYDVFELPPRLTTQEERQLRRRLKPYDFVVSTVPWEGAWVIGQATEGGEFERNQGGKLQKQFQAELRRRGWLTEKAK